MAVKETDDSSDQQDQDSDDTSLDMSQSAVKRMIAEARERGYITYDQLNQVLPPEQVSSEQIEDVMSMLSEMGINIIEDDEAEEGAEPVGELVEVIQTDAGLTAKVLKLCNSAYYGFRREIASLPEAGNMLGCSTLVNQYLNAEFVQKLGLGRY